MARVLTKVIPILFAWGHHDIQRATEAVNAAPEIREDRVAAAKEALKNGTLTLQGVDLAEKLFHYEIERERAIESLRQQKETFEQMKKHESRWFALRLIMGYSSVILLAMIMVISCSVLFNSSLYPTSVVTVACTALFVDVLGLLTSVWKIVLNPSLITKLQPVTAVQPGPTSPATPG